MGYYSVQRREQIMRILDGVQNITVRELADQLKISTVTVRKELKYLEERGELVRTHGGALMHKPGTSLFTLEEKSRKFTTEKQAIGRRAAALVEDSECLYMDSGSTVAHLTPYLANRRGLTVLANSLKLVFELSSQNCHRLLLMGGEFRKEHLDTVVGSYTINFENFVNVSIFIGADGVDPKNGITSVDKESAQILELLLPCAGRIVLCADYSKFGRTGHYRVLPLDKVDYLVSDRKPPSEILEAGKNIKFIYSDPARK